MQKPVNIMLCSKCNREVFPIEGVTSLYQKGCYWCVHCVTILKYENGIPVVDNMSEGKLISDYKGELYEREAKD